MAVEYIDVYLLVVTALKFIGLPCLCISEARRSRYSSSASLNSLLLALNDQNIFLKSAFARYDRPSPTSA
jgi:hypothetical protein